MSKTFFSATWGKFWLILAINTGFIGLGISANVNPWRVYFDLDLIWFHLEISYHPKGFDDDYEEGYCTCGEKLQIVRPGKYQCPNCE
jgi:hypothetical protein